MGNCLCLPKKEKRRIAPDKDDRDVCAIIGQSTEIAQCKKKYPEDMMIALKDKGDEPVVNGQNISFTVDVNDRSEDVRLPARIRKAKLPETTLENAGKSISFIVDASEMMEDARLPPRLRKNTLPDSTPAEVNYTAEEEILIEEILDTAEREERRKGIEEKMIMAKCLREARLKERQEKARQATQRRTEVLRRRGMTHLDNKSSLNMEESCDMMKDDEAEANNVTQDIRASGTEDRHIEMEKKNE